MRLLVAAAGERPDVWIEPHKSIILELKYPLRSTSTRTNLYPCFGSNVCFNIDRCRYFCIVPSDKFNIGRTLRFPRCQRIRHDKNWNECITRDQLQKYHNHSHFSH